MSGEELMKSWGTIHSMQVLKNVHWPNRTRMVHRSYRASTWTGPIERLWCTGPIERLWCPMLPSMHRSQWLNDCSDISVPGTTGVIAPDEGYDQAGYMRLVKGDCTCNHKLHDIIAREWYVASFVFTPSPLSTHILFAPPMSSQNHVTALSTCQFILSLFELNSIQVLQNSIV